MRNFFKWHAVCLPSLKNTNNFVVMENRDVDVCSLFFTLQYRGLAPMYYRGSAAAIVVYDISSEVSVVCGMCECVCVGM